MRILPYLLLLPLLVSCASPGRPGVVLGKARGDFNGDRRKDTLSLVWTGGRYYVDEEMWCGNGPKYTGRFVLRMKFAGQAAVETELKQISDRFEFIHASDKQPWLITLADYNHDGRPDFNLGSYGSCSWNDFSLFTVLTDGKVVPLKIAEDKVPYLRSEEKHSTAELELTTTGFKNLGYDRMSEECFEVHYAWDAKQEIFRHTERRWKDAP